MLRRRCNDIHMRGNARDHHKRVHLRSISARDIGIQAIPNCQRILRTHTLRRLNEHRWLRLTRRQRRNTRGRRNRRSDRTVANQETALRRQRRIQIRHHEARTSRHRQRRLRHLLPRHLTVEPLEHRRRVVISGIHEVVPRLTSQLLKRLRAQHKNVRTRLNNLRRHLNGRLRRRHHIIRVNVIAQPIELIRHRLRRARGIVGNKHHRQCRLSQPLQRVRNRRAALVNRAIQIQQSGIIGRSDRSHGSSFLLLRNRNALRRIVDAQPDCASGALAVADVASRQLG